MSITFFIAATIFLVATLLFRLRWIRAWRKKLDIRERILDSRATALQCWEDDLKTNSHKLAKAEMGLRDRLRSASGGARPKAPLGKAPSTGEPSCSR